MEPGAEIQTEVSGYVKDLNLTTASLIGSVYDVSGIGVTFDVSVPVVKTLGRASGIVYGDANGNGSTTRVRRCPTSR